MYLNTWRFDVTHMTADVKIRYEPEATPRRHSTLLPISGIIRAELRTTCLRLQAETLFLPFTVSVTRLTQATYSQNLQIMTPCKRFSR